MSDRPRPLTALSQALALTCTLGFALPSSALADLKPIFGREIAPVEALDDEELNHLRGRFSTSNGVLEIGVDLRSIWQSPDGMTITAGASIQANASEIAAGTARIRTVATAVPGSSAGSLVNTSTSAPRGVITGVNPAESVTGLAQAVQIAGDRNQVANRLQFDVVRAPTPPSAIDTVSSTPSTLASTTEATLANGSRAVAQVGAGGLQVAIDVPGVGSSQQRLGNSPEHSGIMQSVRINADAQSVTNLASIRLNLAPITPATAINDHIVQVIRSMNGLRR
jgi:hypothetical protein